MQVSCKHPRAAALEARFVGCCAAGEAETPPQSPARRRVKEAADMLGLEELLNRRLKILSEGQKKRVALGRAIIRKPKLFLFDEPLNGLDEKVQVQIRTEIEKLHERYGTTILYAAHDKDEAKKFDAENNRILLF